MGILGKSLLPACLAVMTGTCAAQALYDVNVSSIDIESTGVRIVANYKNAAGTQQCPNSAIYTQVWVDHFPAASEYHGACYVNAVTDSGPNAASTGYCTFKSPRGAGAPGTPFVRLWKITQDCQSYAFEVGQTSPSAYQQNWVYAAPSTALRFYGYNNNTLETITTSKYIAKIDRRGGATYEFYNRRARLNGDPNTEYLSNAIHPDVGAALQIAIHDKRASTISSPCADAANPFVNPTQAGSFCNTGSISGSSPALTSAGGAFPGLSGSVLDTPWFNVLNWNYSNLASSTQNDRIRGPLRKV